MRLAFSVAIHVKPEILFIDEILAVGDQAFQDKCFKRLHEFKRSNVTMIIVSHDLRSLQNICERLIWIEKGVVTMSGEPREVMAAYTDYMRRQNVEKMISQNVADKHRWGSGEIKYRGVKLKNSEGEYTDILRANEAVEIEMAWEASEPIDNPQFGLSIFRQNDNVQLNSPNTFSAGHRFGIVEGCGEISYRINDLPLLPGAYYISVSIHDKQGVHLFDFIDQCLKFEVTFTDRPENYGFLSLSAGWEFKQHE